VAIKGFQGTSLLDYPGHIAALVFFGGCNLTCAYCHNPSLVLEPETLPDFPMDDLLGELQRRRNFIDGVVISGGEPTLDPQLLPLLRQIKELGLQVKLDTNGLAPKVLKEVIWEGLVDLVALDLKTAPARYGELHTGPVASEDLVESVRLLMDGPVDCEFRTTCMPGLVGEAEIRELGAMIRGADCWMLQQYVPRHALAESAQAVEPYQVEQIEALAVVARKFVDEVGIRGL
jgi:pyruvate formate lyase activating enzyme